MADKRIIQLDPLSADQILPDDMFALDRPGFPEAKKFPFSALKTAIIGTVDDDTSIKVFYVDGNNPTNGDGSILNPFKTLELAYAKVIGAGAALTPDYPNVNIEVNAAVYNTSLNLWINNVTWTFKDNTQIIYNGSDYLIDLSAPTSINGIFRIKGAGNFTIPNGGFIKNLGIGISQPYQKNLEIEVNNVNGYTPLGSTSNPTMSQPLIWIGKTATGGGYAAPNLNLIVQGTVNSLFQTLIFQDGSVAISVSGTTPFSSIAYAVRTDTNVFPNNGNPAGCVWRFINLDTSSRKYMGNIKLENISVVADRSDRVFYFEGSLGSTSYIKNIIVSPAHGVAFVGRVIEFGDLELVSYQSSPLGNFIIEEMKLSTELTYTNVDVVRWVGTTSGKNKLDFMRCYFPGVTRYNTNVNFNGNIGVAENVIKNNFHLSNVPVFANNAAAVSAGKITGHVYQDSTGTLKIVQ